MNLLAVLSVVVAIFFQNCKSFLAPSCLLIQEQVEIAKTGHGKVITTNHAAEKSLGQAEEIELESDDQYLDVYDYMKAFLADRKIKLNRKILIRLMDLPVETNFHFHLARISVVMATISKINQTGRSHDKERVLKIVQNGWSLIHIKNDLQDILEASNRTLTENELEDNLTDPERHASPVINEKTALVVTILQMIQSNPDQFLNLVLRRVSAYNLVSKETFQVFEMSLKMFPKTTYFPSFIEWLTQISVQVASTGYGEKLILIVPKLARAENVSSIVKIIEKETNLSLKAALLQLNHPDRKRHLLHSSAVLVTKCASIVQNLINDRMKMSIVNAVLLAQGFPSINPRKIIESGLKLVEKLLRFFTPWRVTFVEWEQAFISHLSEFERNGKTWDEFKTVPKSEQVQLMSLFLNQSFSQIFEPIFNANLLVFKNSKCSADYLLCKVNSVLHRGTKLQTGVTKVLSLFSAWAWSLDGNLNQAALLEAISNGENEADCNKIYKFEIGQDCQLFPLKTHSTLIASEIESDDVSAFAHVEL